MTAHPLLAIGLTGEAREEQLTDLAIPSVRKAATSPCENRTYSFTRMGSNPPPRDRQIHLKHTLNRPHTFRIGRIDRHHAAAFAAECRMRQFAHRRGNKPRHPSSITILHTLRQSVSTPASRVRTRSISD